MIQISNQGISIDGWTPGTREETKKRGKVQRTRLIAGTKKQHTETYKDNKSNSGFYIIFDINDINKVFIIRHKLTMWSPVNLDGVFTKYSCESE